MNGVINNDKLAEVFAALLGWLIVKIFNRGFRGNMVWHTWRRQRWR